MPSNMRYMFLTSLVVSSTYLYFYYAPYSSISVHIYTSSSCDEYLPPMQCLKEYNDPCQTFIDWTLKSDNKTLHTKLEFSEFMFDIKSTMEKSYIKIITYNKLNQSKLIGGDFWWMNVVGPSSFHVELKDNNNGTYESFFSFVEPGNYTVTVELIWSLCDGLRDPPSWWFKSGDEQGKFQKRGSLGVDTYIGKKKEFAFTISESKTKKSLHNRKRNFVKFKRECQPINSPCGYWKNHQQFITPHNPNIVCQDNIKPPENSTIWFYGDSMQLLTYRYFINKTLCKKFFKCGVSYNWNYPNPPSKGIFDNKDFNKSIILNSIGNVLLQKDMRQRSSVFYVNFGVHILMAIPFKQAVDLLQSFVELVQTLKSKLGENFPRIIWKTTTPPFRREYYKYNEDFRRFLTKQRMILWNTYCKEMMCRANIPVIDVYYVTASFTLGAKDGLHFADHVYENAMSAFESYVLNNNGYVE
ncbi:uncharacterized protein LOC130648168 [Hydractinia symbiolongicarpus]|uniref:uncharacterized protein LOC130648168 n=1 Tax=Hydractinia symbiolongicarpus TaxID=13093 RepID=UPI00254E7F6A|nr:uncharacterized protein LOC130648168 [Hydractinia symbiolongicarpus]